jgi:hypothetical protein
MSLFVPARKAGLPGTRIVVGQFPQKVEGRLHVDLFGLRAIQS